LLAKINKVPRAKPDPLKERGIDVQSSARGKRGVGEGGGKIDYTTYPIKFKKSQSGKGKRNVLQGGTQELGKLHPLNTRALLCPR